MNFLSSTQNIFPNQFYFVYQIHPAFMNYCEWRETYVHQPAWDLGSSFWDCNVDDKINEVEDPSFTQSYMFTGVIKKRSKTNYVLREIDFEAKAQNLLRNIISKSFGGGILIFRKKKAIAKFGPISRKKIYIYRSHEKWR